MQRRTTLDFFVGGICLAAGTVFLLTNSVILARGAYKYGHDTIDQIAFGAAASVVPWVIAVLTIVVGVSWRRTWFGLKRPTSTTLIGAGMWLVFVLYNLANGAGVIAGARQEIVAERRHDADTTQSLMAQRDVLRSQLAGIPQHRPPAAVAKLLEAERTSYRWTSTDGCNPDQITASASRKFCDQVRTLEAEMASGEEAQRLTEEIAKLSTAVAAAKPVLQMADPQTELLHDITGADRKRISLWLSGSTPIVLEVGGAFALHFAAMFFGITLRPQHGHIDEEAIAAPQKPAEPVFNPAPLPPPIDAARPPASTTERLTAQRKLCEWFWSTCSRPIASGSMNEDDWYEHYCSFVRRQNDAPLEIDAFRRIASRKIPRLQQIEDQWIYYGVLPLIPEGAA